MFDERTLVLLDILNKKCNSGAYKIITVDELVLEFPSKYGADCDLILQMTKNLSGQGFISLKYNRDNEFCLSLTPKARLYCETELKNDLQNKKSSITGLLPHFFNFLSIFFAIFLAFLLLKLIGVIC